MIVEKEKLIEIDRSFKPSSIPPTVKEIGDLACFCCGITSLNLKNSNITKIGKYAFANCHSLEILRFPTSLEEICEGAFMNCDTLNQTIFPVDSKLKKIGPKAFCRCNCVNFGFPPLIEIIGKKAFQYCNNQKSNLRNTNVRHIGPNALGNAWRGDVFYPSTVTATSVIENHGKNVEVDENHPVIKRDKCGYYMANSTIFQGFTQAKRVLIRRGVERIAKMCFYQSKLVSVSFPSSVVEIGEQAFTDCRYLRWIRFNKDSRLKEIKKRAFSLCRQLKMVEFPRSLKILKGSFIDCSIEEVVFPDDSQLEIIDGAFSGTIVKHLSLPPSVREINNIHTNVPRLESIHVSNDLFESNKEETAIFSKDGTELICVINRLKHFKIPRGVRVIRKNAFKQSMMSSERLLIPSSVEVIESKSLCFSNGIKIIEFEKGSRLKSLAYDSFHWFENLIINSKNFVRKANGAVLSSNPNGIVHIPKDLIFIKIDPNVEVIYDRAFASSIIRSIQFPKSLKKICSCAFIDSNVESVSFEKGTELDFIGSNAFDSTKIKDIKLPLVKGEIGESAFAGIEKVEFPPNFEPRFVHECVFGDNFIQLEIICPKSSLAAIAHIYIRQEDIIIT